MAADDNVPDQESRFNCTSTHSLRSLNRPNTCGQRFFTTARSGEFTSSVLLSYKLNWQSAMFIGYGDARELTDVDRLAPSDRQFFVKLSYAFQR